MAITVAQIQQIVPRTPLHVAREVADWLDRLALLFDMRTMRQQAAFLAQVTFETNGLKTHQATNYLVRNWNAGHCGQLAETGNFRTITRAFDKNLTGYGARLLVYKRALRILGVTRSTGLNQFDPEC